MSLLKESQMSVQVVPMLNRAVQKLLVMAFSGFVMHNPLLW
ncbi:hypothetical protein ACIBQ1_23970 [Nonomuraea sp. NPDC050153]